MNTQKEIYKRLVRVIPNLYSIKESGKSESPGFMGFNLDILQRKGNVLRIAISHYYMHPSGDMIADPDMEVHWVWYAGLFTAVLSRLFESNGVAHKYDWVLLLPLGSGLLDLYENRLQHIFLSTSDFATIVDPLPLYSTLASDVKWLFSAIYVSLAFILLIQLFIKRRRNAVDRYSSGLVRSLFIG